MGFEPHPLGNLGFQDGALAIRHSLKLKCSSQARDSNRITQREQAGTLSN
jgi:hypothetical protein